MTCDIKKFISWQHFSNVLYGDLAFFYLTSIRCKLTLKCCSHLHSSFFYILTTISCSYEVVYSNGRAAFFSKQRPACSVYSTVLLQTIRAVSSINRACRHCKHQFFHWTQYILDSIQASKRDVTAQSTFHRLHATGLLEWPPLVDYSQMAQNLRQLMSSIVLQCSTQREQIIC